MEKKQSFSIRKIGTIVGSFLIASTYFATMAHADSVRYSYVDKQELTAGNQQLIQTDNPTISTDHYYLVYEKNPTQLPHTGFTTSLLIPVVTLSTLAIGSILIAPSKRQKKWGAAFIITASGILPFTQAYALENGLLAQYNQVIEATKVQDGAIQIDGYHYIGYLPVEQVSLPTSTETQTDLSARTIPTNTDSLQREETAAESILSEKGTSTSQEPLAEFPVENVPPVAEKGTSTSQEPLAEFPIENVPPVAEKGTSTSQEPLAEFPIENVPVVTEKGTSTSQEPLTEFPVENVPIVTEKGSSTSQEPLAEFPIENVPIVTEKGTSTSQEPLTEFPVENVPIVTEKGSSTSQEPLAEFPIENVPVVTEKGSSTSQEPLKTLEINTVEHTQRIPVTTTQETSSDLFEDESQTIEGTDGEEKITRLYAKNIDGSNGDLLDESHVTLQEMIPTKVVRGTKVRQKYEELSTKNSLISKFLPYYNLEYLDGQAKTLAASNRITKEILSITPMIDTHFNPTAENANKIFIHYADGTKDEFIITNKRAFNERIDEYDIPELGITYTPRYKAAANAITSATQALSSVELYSDGIYKATNRTNPQNQQQFIQELYFDEAANRVKQELSTLTPLLLENGFTADTIVEHKEKVFLGLTYLENYYNVQFGKYNLKNLLLTDFYGTKQSLANTLISLGGDYNKLRGRESATVFASHFAKHTQSKNLVDFFDYNRKLFTNYATSDDWFKDATKEHVYIAERASNEPELATASYKAYDKLQKGEFINYLLPMLNLKKSQIYVISNYSTLIFGSKDRRPTNTMEQWQKAIETTADRVRDLFDTWYRIADSNVKKRLIKERNIPTWDGYNANGWVDRFGRMGAANEYSSIREFFGPIGKYYNGNGTGAYAEMRGANSFVHFVGDDVLSDYGHSVYSHEMTHNYDNSIYLGGYGRRDGMGAEAFARGLLENPQNGGELGVNLLFDNENDGNRWYNPTPQQFTSQADIDLYMKRYIDTKMAIDYAETDAILRNKHNEFLMTSWFKKMDKQLKANNRDQLDLVRNLNAEEKAAIASINSIDDLIDNNYITAKSINNGTYDGNGINIDAYVRPHTLATFYGGNTSNGAAGAATFKYNAFHMWGYFGYSNGFVGYTSNKYSAAARKADGALNDSYIIQQISNGRFHTLEEWKKAYYAEVKERATTYFKPVTVDGQTFNTYEEVVAKINTLLQQANPTNAASLKKAQDSIHSFKEKLYKAWLKDTNGFQSNTIGL